MSDRPNPGNYPEISKPKTRYATAIRNFWTQTLVTGPTKAHRAIALANNARNTIARKRR